MDNIDEQRNIWLMFPRKRIGILLSHGHWKNVMLF